MRGRGWNLLGVVVVLGLATALAGVLLPRAVRYTEDARIARARSDCARLGAAITSFHNDLGRWPTADGASAALPDVLYFGQSKDYPSLSQRGQGAWRGPYLFEVPADPWGRRYYVNLGAFWATDGAWAGSKENLPNLAGYVLSAGPNGRIETFPRQDGSLAPAEQVADRMYAVGGDDVAFRIK